MEVFTQQKARICSDPTTIWDDVASSHDSENCRIFKPLHYINIGSSLNSMYENCCPQYPFSFWVKNQNVRRYAKSWPNGRIKSKNFPVTSAPKRECPISKFHPPHSLLHYWVYWLTVIGIGFPWLDSRTTAIPSHNMHGRNLKQNTPPTARDELSPNSNPH